MPESHDVFNCGEFRPGKRRIQPHKPDKPISSRIIPYRPDNPDKIIKIKIPPAIVDGGGGGRGSDPSGFKCVDIGAITECPPEAPILVAAGLKRWCVACTKADLINKKVKCHRDFKSCMDVCPSIPVTCKPRPGLVIDPGRGVGTITPGNEWWKCKEEDIECDIGEVVVPPGAKKRKCVYCNAAKAKAKIDDCHKAGNTYFNQAACEKECKTDAYECVKRIGSIGVDDVLKGNLGPIKTGSVGLEDPNTGGQRRDPNQLGKPGDVIEPLSLNALLNNRDTSIRNPTIIDVDEAAKKSIAKADDETSFETVFHPYYNIWAFDTNHEVELVHNDKHLHVWKDVIALEISQIMQYVDSSGPWREQAINDLTTAKIMMSLRSDLLDAFTRITHPDGTLVDISIFLGAVMSLLVQNRLDELDSQYYIALANRKSNDERTIVRSSISYTKNIQAALGTIADTMQPIDPDSQAKGVKTNKIVTPGTPTTPIGSANNIFYRRYRVINTDISPNVGAITTSGTTVNVPVSDSGLNVTLKGSTQGVEVALEGGGGSDIGIVELGDGDGYYFSATTTSGSLARIDTINEASAAYVVSYEDRFKSLNLLNVDPSYEFIVTQSSGLTEFDASFNTTSTFEPMYFKLNLSTIGLEEASDPMTTLTSGVYTRLTEQSSIDAHAASYGYGVTVANVDHRDPFLLYVSSVSSVDMRMFDINFKNFNTNRASTQNALLARGVPMGVVFRPVQGGKHNPFMAMSTLQGFKGDVKRSLKFIPDINTSIDDIADTALDFDFTINKRGTYYLGMVGKEYPDADNIEFYFSSTSDRFKKGYYTVSSSYEDTPNKNRERSAVGHLTYDIIESLLKAKYNLNGLTWYDVFRRLSGYRLHQLTIEGTDLLAKWLSNGGRGVKIYYVLNRSPVQNTGILSTKNEAITDTVYINPVDREWIKAVQRKYA